MWVGIVAIIILYFCYLKKIDSSTNETHIFIMTFIGMMILTLEILKAKGMYINYKNYFHSVELVWDLYFAEQDVDDKKDAK